MPERQEGVPVSEELGERVRATIADAESVALTLRHGADQHAQELRVEAEQAGDELVAEATRRADELTLERVSRLHELAEAISARVAALHAPEEAEAARIVADEARTALEATAAELTGDLSEGAAPADPSVPGPPRRRFARAGTASEGANTSESRARLVAQQMAAAGGSRDEVEEHLRNAFGLDDPAPVAEQVFTRATADAS